MFRTFLAALAVLIGYSSSALAWGADGHRTVAEIADRLLTQRARTQVSALLANEPAGKTDLVSASTWADEIRSSQPATGPFHYVNVPISVPRYIAQLHCPTRACSVGALDHFTQVLRDPRALPAARSEALKWVVHLVGDIHQPLHSGDSRDRGGNDVKVVFQGRGTNLHAVWDTDVVTPLLQQQGPPLSMRLLSTLTRVQVADWQQGWSTRWIAESHAVARDYIYPAIGNIRGGTPQPILLKPTYALEAAPLVRLQLLRAGVRLAMVLNWVLR